jgi:hypothetical protein
MLGSDRVCISREIGVWSQAVGLVSSFGRNPASVAVKVFSHLIYIIKSLYKCCTVSVSYKNSVAINCSLLLCTVQHKSLFPVNFDGLYARLVSIKYKIFSHRHIYVSRAWLVPATWPANRTLLDSLP